ncbi:MAG TPA: peroxiredoxin [Bryobacteraceae bacterium]|nr:peroxiredoxin [Bryobacteraceae bacterium]
MLSSLFAKPLPAGTPAPDFTLPDQTGRPVRLADFRGRDVVLVFYPGDDTTVCRKQLCEFRDSWQVAQERNAAVFGVNPQSAASHEKFAQRYSFPFPLLVDKGQRVGALYHAAGLIVRRTVYRIGPEGTIRYASRGKPPVSAVFAE